MQDCPRCRVINTDSALHCSNCLFNFRNPASELLPASFWQRFQAFWLDGLLLIIVTLLLALLGIRNQKSVAFMVAFWLVFWIYFAWMKSSTWQATCGKLLVGLRVSDLAGHRISLGRAAGRNLGRVLSVVFGIGYIPMIFTQRKLHDLLASCVVSRSAALPETRREKSVLGL
jgi:uncharacterized RDD family membrane protein YckC